MKRWISCIAGVWICLAFTTNPPFEKQVLDHFSRHLQMLPAEKLYLHTDKSVYNAGETIWFRGYLLSSLNHVPMRLSRFLYADLVDRRDSLVTRIKVMAPDTTFSGYLRLPEELPQGDYTLRGYTLYMQNEGEDFLFHKKIRVVNPRDSRVKTAVTFEKEPAGGYVAKIRLSNPRNEPYAREVVRYVSNLTRPDAAARTARADNSGEIAIRITPEMKFLELSFTETAHVSLNRRIHIPDLWNEFDIQFFPEGGALLAGNWQQVAFKAIGADGMGVEVTGDVYQDSVIIASFSSEYDGMGCVRIPVSPAHHYSVVTRLKTGEEKRTELPVPSMDGFGLTVGKNDSILTYRILKGPEAVFPPGMSVLAHCRGNVLAIYPVERLFRGEIPLSAFPEGVSHIALVDPQGNVYSQRLVFVKHTQRPEIDVVMEKPVYSARELISLNLVLEETAAPCGGLFSVSVTDDGQVPLDSLEDNILSNLLLVSDLKGYIHQPGYYFSDDSPTIDRHLDLVMLTHGWTRFDLSRIVVGNMPRRAFPLEIGQMISGKVDNFGGKKSIGANVILLSTNGIIQMVETDDQGRFEVDGITFPDSTNFLVQALDNKGRKRVKVTVENDSLIAPRYRFPLTLESHQEESSFYDLYGKDYYYDNGEKIYVLNEVTVVRRKKQKEYSIYDRMARYNVDSAAIAESGVADLIQLIQVMLPGVILEQPQQTSEEEPEEEYFTHFSRKLYLLVNDFEEKVDYLRMIDPRAVRSISLMDETQGFMFFGERAAGGALIVSYDFAYIPPRLQPLHIKPFTVLGYQKPDAFYMPKYDVDSVRRSARYDTRSTIYWKPVQPISSETEHTLSFFSADTPGTYTVTIEGVTGDGIICRKRFPIKIR